MENIARTKSSDPVQFHPMRQPKPSHLEKKNTHSTHHNLKSDYSYKRVYILYACGSAGSSRKLETSKGDLKSRIKSNTYLCDFELTESLDDPVKLVSPKQQNDKRLVYEIEQFEYILPSRNFNLEGTKEIVKRIDSRYEDFDAFVIICGFDVMTYIATIASFMFQNLGKLVIFTGGYFPFSFMYNDNINNLIESFCVISHAQNLCDVVIVCKNNAYRANRSLKNQEGHFETINSPNLPALVSINVKIQLREYLFLPVPKDNFSIRTDFSQRVGTIKMHPLLSTASVRHQISDPTIDGFVIQSYGPGNLPEDEEMLGVFKTAAEEQSKIFINLSQSVRKVTKSIMQKHLDKHHIFFGGDMTIEAALAKLAYLLSRNLSREEIKQAIYTNLRGQLTEKKTNYRFEVQQLSFMEVVEQSIKHYYPSHHYSEFMSRMADQLAQITTSAQATLMEQLFRKVKIDPQKAKTTYPVQMAQLVDSNNILHSTIKKGNRPLYNHFLTLPVQTNRTDDKGCSPLYYALVKEDKAAIETLLRHSGEVICPLDTLFQLLVRHLKRDHAPFFELMYHVHFKQTLRDLTNPEKRNCLHLAALMGASKSLKLLLDRFKFNLKSKDNYDKLYTDYVRQGLQRRQARQSKHKQNKTSHGSLTV